MQGKVTLKIGLEREIRKDSKDLSLKYPENAGVT